MPVVGYTTAAPIANVTVTRPTESRAGDVLVVMVARDIAGTGNLRLPSAFRQIGPIMTTSTPDGAGSLIGVRVVGHAEPSTYTTSNIDPTDAVCVALRGVTLRGLRVGLNAQYIAKATPWNAPGTALWLPRACEVLYLADHNVSVAVSVVKTPPHGFTSVVDYTNGDLNHHVCVKSRVRGMVHPIGRGADTGKTGATMVRVLAFPLLDTPATPLRAVGTPFYRSAALMVRARST